MSGEQDIANLRWAVDCNARGIGYLGPTVKRHGPLPELAELVAAGLLRCEEDCRTKGHRDTDKCGYFITPAGRAALSGSRTPLTAEEIPGGTSPSDLSHLREEK